MLRAIGVVAVLAAACGRLDFDALTGPCARATTVPDPIAISGLTIQVSDFAGDFTPLPQTTVTVTDANDGATIGSATSDATGAYSIAVPTGGMPRSVIVEFTKATFLANYLYPPRALDRDFVRNVNVFGGGSLSAVYGAATGLPTIDGADGTLIVFASDCTGAPLPGVTVAVSPRPEDLEYTGSASSPFPIATATQPPNAQAVGFNQPPGEVGITATEPGAELVVPTATVFANSVSNVMIEPLE